jgi:RimJ/RimL family protein N-acetyltransferase
MLRPWAAQDAAMVKAAFDEPDIQLWHMRRMDSLQEAEEWVGSWAGRWADETDAAWAIAEADTDAPIGYAALRTLFLAGAAGQVSYWLVPRARGRGVATRAAATVATWALETLRLQRVYLSHSVVNAPSCRVAINAGFAAEGTMRRYMLHADGWHDMHLHARIASNG